MTQTILFARLRGLKFDIGALQEFFVNSVATTPARQYQDNNENYDGWAVTSRDGSVTDYITKRDGMRQPKTGKPHPLARIPKLKATVPTALCEGAVKDAMKAIEDHGLVSFRARLLRLKTASYSMGFHMDGLGGRETWRLHVPIFTSPESFFQWRAEDGEMTQVHMPADGSGYLVRVDLPHRAVYNVVEPLETGRVHLIMGIRESPRLEQIEPLLLASTSNSGGKRRARILDHTIWMDETSGTDTATDDRTNIGPGVAPVKFRLARGSNISDITCSRQRPAYLVIDQASGETLKADNAGTLFHSAGLIKLMVLYEIFDALRRDYLSLDTVISIPDTNNQKPQRKNFWAGSKLTIEQAIRALVQRQTSRVARAIAKCLLGDEVNFAARLTERAKTLGMIETRILNVTGRHHPKQVSTPWDMVKLCQILMLEFPEYMTYFRECNFTFKKRVFTNRNLLLGTCEGVDGLITARNRVSGHHAAVTAVRRGRRLIALLAGAESAQAAADRVADLLTEAYTARQ